MFLKDMTIREMTVWKNNSWKIIALEIWQFEEKKEKTVKKKWPLKYYDH